MLERVSTLVDSSTRAALVVRGVSVSYDGPSVLTNTSLDVRPGEVVSLLGPSGCGKTTLLRVMAGLHAAEQGEVIVGDRVVDGPGVFVRPEHRRIGMVFQDGALFPHMTVADNVRFGLRASNDADERVSEALSLVGMAEFADRLPGRLSGGQQQRVALARALAPRPSVLLLDEPFSALDAGLRVQLRRDVKRILSDVGVTVVVVTHDQDEAFVLGDRVAVMRDGVIQQVGSPSELYQHPANPWVARFVGEANFVTGTMAGSAVDTELGHLAVRQHDTTPSAGPALVLIRPEELGLRRLSEGETELDGIHSGLIGSVEYFGHDARYDVMLDSGEQLAVRLALADYAEGDRVEVVVTGRSVAAFDPD